MELKTTMVRFNVPKRQMLKSTENATLFDLGDDKIWIPHKKMIVNTDSDSNFNEVVMPRWVFLKTNLPLYFKQEEFNHTLEINQL